MAPAGGHDLPLGGPCSSATSNRVVKGFRVQGVGLVHEQDPLRQHLDKVGQLFIVSCTHRHNHDRGSSLQLLKAARVQEREAILEKVAGAIEANQDAILAENEADVEAAEGNIDAHLMNRLRLKPQKIQQLAKGIRSIAAQDEPLRKVQGMSCPGTCLQAELEYHAEHGSTTRLLMLPQSGRGRRSETGAAATWACDA